MKDLTPQPTSSLSSTPCLDTLSLDHFFSSFAASNVMTIPPPPNVFSLPEYPKVCGNSLSSPLDYRALFLTWAPPFPRKHQEKKQRSPKFPYPCHLSHLLRSLPFISSHLRDPDIVLLLFSPFPSPPCLSTKKNTCNSAPFPTTIMLDFIA